MKLNVGNLVGFGVIGFKGLLASAVVFVPMYFIGRAMSILEMGTLVAGISLVITLIAWGYVVNRFFKWR